ncbi:hypothetical protein KP79_PYT02580 [Mizuhopecten yessoensis]|uniref:DDE Tnp4 domain-containing protein n=1 Tax=Mizuhopecten yessoensis TaxID=6573 RepID=A0A210PKD5_MIZYE|nr:hypothetical protein KP79_PYT02580 [Mizuhopecten yessoensis]
MSTEDANNSRLVTKLRWAVETVNGRLKTWKYLSNKDLPNIWDLICIIAALCNKYRPPLRTSLPSDCDVARQMVECAAADNTVQHRVMSESNVKRRSKIWRGGIPQSEV